MSKALDEFESAQADLVKACTTLTGKLKALVGECAALEGRKATLAVEVAAISDGLEPLKREREGQRREVSKAYEAVREAQIEADKKKAAINMQIQDLEKQAEEARIKAENSATNALIAKQKELDDLDKQLEVKKRLLGEFKAKLMKDL
jgi:chromosome segregation ATPase